MAMLYVGPNQPELKKMLERGLTQQQIVDEWEEKTGFRVGRSTISRAMSEWGLTPANPRDNYSDLLPWHVHSQHQMDVEARMLRLEARRRLGKPLNEREQRRLDYWMEDLTAANAVVTYDQKRGFRLIKRRPEHTDIIDPPEDKEGASPED